VLSVTMATMRLNTAIRLGLLLAAFVGVASTSRASTRLDYDSTIRQGTVQLQAGSADLALASAEAATRTMPARWEGHALLGRSLLALERYEPAADAFSKAIQLAPQSEQLALRDQRRQCLLAETAAENVGASMPAATVDSRVDIEAARRIVSRNDAEWFDASSGLAWARPWFYPSHDARQWNFEDAQAFCSNLNLVGHADWRLPSADELQRIFLVSAPGWQRARPRFVAGYGLNQAMSDGRWTPDSFAVNGTTFQGNRLFLWTSTTGVAQGQHVGLYFGVPHSIDDHLRSGQSQWGRMMNPFQGYALCVRTTTPAD
jgi:hypothetical protein